MFELIIYTLFYLLFPNAPDVSTLPSDVPPWQPTYFQAKAGPDLAMRFMNDAFEQSYFKHDATKYSSLYEQNATRARVQLTLLEDIIQKKFEIDAIVSGS